MEIFHSERVKENVYIPDWTSKERLEYTIQCAHVLAKLLPVGTEGSISTVPLGFKGFEHPGDFQDRCIDNLIELALALDELHDENRSKSFVWLSKPEPLCVLETTPETLEFFNKLRHSADRAGHREAVDRHLGVCYDVCHQSVEFEDVEKSIQELSTASIRINKVHITCAIQIEKPSANPEARESLVHFVEPRYLHQTFAKASDGSIHRETDLSASLIESTPEEFKETENVACSLSRSGRRRYARPVEDDTR